MVDPTLSYSFKAPIDARRYYIGLYVVQIVNQLESFLLIAFNFVCIFGAHEFSIETVGLQVITVCTSSFSFCWLRGLASCPTGNFG